jgi:hypothetical protein
MGQRLILFAGVIIALAVVVAPAAIVGGITWLVLYRLAGPVGLIPAALACLATVSIEVVLITEALGPVYERIDLTGIERAE